MYHLLSNKGVINMKKQQNKITTQDLKNSQTLELLAQCSNRGITLNQLADMVGISPASLNKKLSGATEFKYNEIVAITKALALTDELVMSIFFNY